VGGLIRYRLQRLRYRGAFGGGATTLVMAGAILLVVMTGIALVTNSIARASMPDYSAQAAQMVGENVRTQVAAAVMYDTTMASQITARGPQSWTQSITVKGVATNASVTTTPTGSVLLIDVVVNTATYRTFAPLGASSIAPGTVVHGG